jgi:hypothetical protein
MTTCWPGSLTTLGCRTSYHSGLLERGERRAAVGRDQQVVCLVGHSDPVVRPRRPPPKASWRSSTIWISSGITPRSTTLEGSTTTGVRVLGCMLIALGSRISRAPNDDRADSNRLLGSAAFEQRGSVQGRAHSRPPTRSPTRSRWWRVVRASVLAGVACPRPVLPGHGGGLRAPSAGLRRHPRQHRIAAARVPQIAPTGSGSAAGRCVNSRWQRRRRA